MPNSLKTSIQTFHSLMFVIEGLRSTNNISGFLKFSADKKKNNAIL